MQIKEFNIIWEDVESFTGIDLHFADFIGDIADNKEPWLYFAAALASNAIQNGHVCVDLSSQYIEYLINKNNLPNISEWIRLLKTISVVGGPGDYKPLILENTRLYLHKYWQFEQQLSAALLERAQSIESISDTRLVSSAMSKLFNNSELKPIDLQYYSAIIALLKNLVIISGGPGTGKTTTAAKIIALLMITRDIPYDRIALAAPTGKAAARLKNAFVKAFGILKNDLAADPNIEKGFNVFTIHRLLGAIPYSPFFKHNAEKPLPYEVIVIDEASMVDIALMTKLLLAIRPQSKIILLGDKDQLASVEAGAFFSDLCAECHDHAYRNDFKEALEKIAPTLLHVRQDDEGVVSDPSSFPECVVELTTNHRFSDNSGIGILSRAIRRGAVAEAVSILSDNSRRGISWQDLPPAHMLMRALHPIVINFYGRIFKERDPLKVLRLFESFRVLCALRIGPFGVSAVNSGIERILALSGAISSEAVWYEGRPVLITGNDYNLGLFNGDIGITMRDQGSDGNMKVFFPGETSGTLKSFSPHRLPQHETAFAITVHKAQGSEFDRALILLPPSFIPLLSRELLYTGITRAREYCEIWSSKEILQKAIENPTKRNSGLREKIWGNK